MKNTPKAAATIRRNVVFVDTYFSDGFFLPDAILSNADVRRFARVSLFFDSTIHVTYSRLLVNES